MPKRALTAINLITPFITLVFATYIFIESRGSRVVQRAEEAVAKAVSAQEAVWAVQLQRMEDRFERQDRDFDRLTAAVETLGKELRTSKNNP